MFSASVDCKKTNTNQAPKPRKTQSPSRKSRNPFSIGPMKNASSSPSNSGQDLSATVTTRGEMSPQVKRKTILKETNRRSEDDGLKISVDKPPNISMDKRILDPEHDPLKERRQLDTCPR